MVCCVATRPGASASGSVSSLSDTSPAIRSRSPPCRGPRLAELCEETGESVQLYVRDGERRRCAVSFPSPHGLRWMVGEGALLPLHLGSAGRVLTGEVGRDGWVETVEEREPGVASVSAPIAAPSTGVLAAVSVGGPIERLSREPGKRFGADVVEAATDIAGML